MRILSVLILLLLAVAPPLRAEPLAIFGGAWMVEVPKEMDVIAVSKAEEEPQRVELARPGLARALSAIGIDAATPAVQAALPPFATGTDYRGRIFLVRFRATLNEVGRSAEWRFARDCDQFFRDTQAIRAFDPLHQLGHCAALGRALTYVVCTYAQEDTICGGGLDSVEFWRLQDDPLLPTLISDWAAARIPEAAWQLLTTLRAAGMVEDLEAILLSLRPIPQ